MYIFRLSKRDVHIYFLSVVAGVCVCISGGQLGMSSCEDRCVC